MNDDKPYSLFNGDALTMLRSMPDNSVDSIVTDPPAGIGFMGAAWDKTDGASQFIDWLADIMAEGLRVLKPGGHALVWALPRTSHWTAWALDEVGFEIRDKIYHLFGSGMPKSHNVGKAIGKSLGGEREDEARKWEGFGTSTRPACEEWVIGLKPFSTMDIMQMVNILDVLEARLWLLSSVTIARENSGLSPSECAGGLDIARWTVAEAISLRAVLLERMDTLQLELGTATSLSIVSSWRSVLVELCDLMSMSTISTASNLTIALRTLSYYLSEITPEGIILAVSPPNGLSSYVEIAGKLLNAIDERLKATRLHFAAENAIEQAVSLANGASDLLPVESAILRGGLRPNSDEWILARKPLDGTIAENVLKWGVGALNIEATRIPVDDEESDVLGRWPANVAHDGSDEVLDRLPTTAAVGQPRAALRENEQTMDKRYNDTGATNFAAKPGMRRSTADSAARFFYCSKITKADRDEGLDDFEEKEWVYQTANGTSGRPSSLSEGRSTAYRNTHPTPKSTKLMRWLCRLITPPGGVVLDMFAGSGSTGKAAILEGFRFVGSEKEREYYEIAVARLDDAVMRAGAPVQRHLFEEHIQ